MLRTDIEESAHVHAFDDEVRRGSIFTPGDGSRHGIQYIHSIFVLLCRDSVCGLQKGEVGFEHFYVMCRYSKASAG